MAWPPLDHDDGIKIVSGDILRGSDVVGCMEGATIVATVQRPRDPLHPDELFIRTAAVTWMKDVSFDEQLSLTLSGDDGEFVFPNCRRRSGGFQALPIADGSYGKMAYLPQQRGTPLTMRRGPDGRES